MYEYTIRIRLTYEAVKNRQSNLIQQFKIRATTNLDMFKILCLNERYQDLSMDEIVSMEITHIKVEASK